MTQIDTSELKSIALKNYRIPPGRGDIPKSFFQTVFIWLAEWSSEKRFKQEIPSGYCAIVLAPQIVERRRSQTELKRSSSLRKTRLPF